MIVRKVEPDNVLDFLSSKGIKVNLGLDHYFYFGRNII